MKFHSAHSTRMLWNRKIAISTIFTIWLTFLPLRMHTYWLSFHRCYHLRVKPFVFIHLNFDVFKKIARITFLSQNLKIARKLCKNNGYFNICGSFRLIRVKVVWFDQKIILLRHVVQILDMFKARDFWVLNTRLQSVDEKLYFEKKLNTKRLVMNYIVIVFTIKFISVYFNVL